MTEMDLRRCKQCHELVVRIRDGNFPNTNVRFVNDKGSLWNGSKCPHCHRKNVAKTLQIRREYNKIH